MADDNKELENKESENTESKKNWQWDAAAPLTDEDFLSRTISAKTEKAEKKKNSESKNTKDDNEGSEEKAEEPEEKEIPPGCCIICGEKIRKSKSELYCNECRSRYMKVDIGATHIILSVVTVFIAVIGIVLFANTLKITAAVKEGDKLQAQGNSSAALDAYYKVDEKTAECNNNFNAFLKGISPLFEEKDIFSSGSKLNMKKAYLMVKTFRYTSDESSYFINYIDTSFTQKELNSEKYSDIKEFYDFLSKFDTDINKTFTDLQKTYMDVVSKISNAQQGMTDAEPPSKEEVQKETDKIFAEADKYGKNHPELTPGAIDYFKLQFNLMLQSASYEVSDEDLFKSMEAVYNSADKYGYIFLNDYVSCAINAEKYDAVLSKCDDALKIDESNATAYYNKAYAYLMSGKFDNSLEEINNLSKYSTYEYDAYELKANVLRRKKEYQAAIDICESVPDSSKTSELLRQAAIAYYLAGDKENAYSYSKKAYDAAYMDSYSGGSSLSLEVVNTCALIYKLCGKDADYDSIVESLKQANRDLEDSVKAVIKGDKTFEDLFMTGKGDI